MHVNGSGEAEILEYPQNFSGQRAVCNSNLFSFPPSHYVLKCKVERFVEPDTSFAFYESDNLTSYNHQMKKLSTKLKRKNELETALEIADWIRKNIKYDLGLGKEQKSAVWTFNNRVGTCDEIAHLFIALARASGLNSRYVSGYALSEGWVPHAWAEVWTSFGWFPIDIPFEEYGVVDSFHIITYKGKSGDHEFIKYRYKGEVSIGYKPEIEVERYSNLSLKVEVKTSKAYSGGYLLLELSIFNPLDFPIAFPIEFGYAKDFSMRKVFGKDYILLYPGRNRKFYVFKVQKIPKNSIYKVPLIISFGEFIYKTNFTVYGWEAKCSVPEPINGGFKLKECLNLDAGLYENFTVGGDYFCDYCYYHLPSNITYKIYYAKKCPSPCKIVLELKGIGMANVSIDKDSLLLPVKGILNYTFETNKSRFFVRVNGREKEIKLEILPNPNITYEIKNGRVCFSSSWKIEKRCFKVECGKNRIKLKISYGNVTLEKEKVIYRRCSIFELFLEKFISFLSFLI